MQTNKAEDAQVSQVCLQAVDTTMDAGYTLPVTSLQLSDRRGYLIQTLRFIPAHCRSSTPMCSGLHQGVPGMFEPYFISLLPSKQS